MRKQVKYGKEARDKVLEGVKKISAAVKVTLGPSGRNVLISQSAVIDYGVHSLPIEVSKDGYRVSVRFDLEDPFEKAGILMVKEAAQKSVDQSGDGTTTTVLLTESIVEKGMALIDKGANPMELKRGIDKGVEIVVEGLKNMAVPIKGDVEKIRQIATVSANNDKEIGDLIAKAFDKIGDEGMMDIEPSKSVNTEIKISDGYKLDKGWISPYFVNKKDKGVCEFIDPLILLYEKRIIHHTQIQKALEIVIKEQRPLLIICEDADEEGLAFLAVNNQQARISCCIVKSPSFGDLRREEMEDIALLTGATYISDSKGTGIKEVTLPMFGSAKKVIISKEDTVIIGGGGEKEKIEEAVNDQRMNLVQAKSENEKLPIEKRIAKLTGGVAVIQVGANTETEMKERLDRFEDAVKATKAALSEGFVAGGGTSFLRIKRPDIYSGLFNDGINVVFDSIQDPLKQICTNAGVDGENKLGLVLEKDNNIGYNAKSDKIEDLVENGIIDPVKVLRCALQNAASSATMILTSECLIVDTL